MLGFWHLNISRAITVPSWTDLERCGATPGYAFQLHSVARVSRGRPWVLKEQSDS